MGSGTGSTTGYVLTGYATRSAFRRPWVISLFFLIAGLYALASMLEGGMLVFGPTGQKSLTVWLVTSGNPWWYFPAWFVVFPGGSLTLPFFPTLSMVLVSIGVGIGMSVAAVIAVRLIQLRRAAAGRPLAAGSIAGLTPAFLALVTMGACCTTTAASAAGLGVVAQTTGTNVNTLLVNSWYLGVFQMVVVLIALLAQEAILVAYGPMLGLGGAPLFSSPSAADPPPLRVRDILAAGIRIVLIGTAVLWSLSAVAATFSSATPLSTAADWFGFIVEHQLVAALIILVALIPRTVRRWLSASPLQLPALVLRGAFLFLGALILTWVPPFWSSAQTGGLVNALLGLFGAPASWGAVSPPFSGPITLALRLGLGFGLLGATMTLVGVLPSWALEWIGPSPTISARPQPTSHGAGRAAGSGGPTPLFSGSPAGGPEARLAHPISFDPPGIAPSSQPQTTLRAGESEGQ